MTPARAVEYGVAAVAIIPLLWWTASDAEKARSRALCGLLGIQILVPALYVHNYGLLKYAIIVLGLLLMLLGEMSSPRRTRQSPGKLCLLPLVALYLILLERTLAFRDPHALNDYLVAVMSWTPGVVLGLHSTSQDRRKVRRFLILAGAFESIFAILEQTVISTPLWTYPTVSGALDIPSKEFSQIFSGLYRSQGTTGDPLLLTVVVVVAFAFLCGDHELFTLRLRLALGALLVSGEILSGSRSGFVIMCFVFLMTVGVDRGIFRLIRFSAMSLVTIAFLFATGAASSSVVSRFLGSDSLSHRQDSIATTPQLLRAQSEILTIFGNGYYSHDRLYAMGYLGGRQFTAVDNQFVTTFTEAGIIGLILIVWFLLLGLSGDRKWRPAVVSLICFHMVLDLAFFPMGVVLLVTTVVLARADVISSSQESERSAQVRPSQATGNRAFNRKALTR